MPHDHEKHHCGPATAKEPTSKKKTNREDISSKKVPMFLYERKDADKPKFKTKKAIQPEFNISLMDKLPKLVPLCYRTSWEREISGIPLTVNRRYFHSKQVIYQNCFSYQTQLKSQVARLEQCSLFQKINL